MKTLVESIFDDDQTYVNKSRFSIDDVRTPNDLTIWLKSWGLFLGDSDDDKKILLDIYNQHHGITSQQAKNNPYPDITLTQTKFNFGEIDYFYTEKLPYNSKGAVCVIMTIVPYEDQIFCKFLVSDQLKKYKIANKWYENLKKALANEGFEPFDESRYPWHGKHLKQVVYIKNK